jgi:voltage-gated potassium channel
MALYAFGVFGYLTATIASFFVGRDAEADAPAQPAVKGIESLHAELAALRAELRAARGA